MTEPALPKGIERDDTEHGKLYWTRAQMLAYGAECAKHAASQVKPVHQSKAVDDLSKIFGFKK